MVEEVAGVRESRIPIFLILCHELLFSWIVVVIPCAGVRIAVIEDDNLVDAEHGKGAGDGAYNGGFEVMCLCAVTRQYH